MRKLLPVIFIVSAFLGSIPAMADEGAGGPVPGTGPGGAGVTDDAPLSDIRAMPSVTHGDAMAVYYPRLAHRHRITGKIIN